MKTRYFSVYGKGLSLLQMISKNDLGFALKQFHYKGAENNFLSSVSIMYSTIIVTSASTEVLIQLEKIMLFF
jgi:hypothetical protein